MAGKKWKDNRFHIVPKVRFLHALEIDPDF